MTYENKTSRPTYEQLLEEVIELGDGLARMKRMYEDLLYNLDYENLGTYLSADLKKFMLSFKEVYPDGSTGESRFSITAEEILSTVSRTYETQEDAGIRYTTLNSSISQTATNILSTVSATYETRTDAGTQYAALQSSISQTADSITSTVAKTYATQLSVSQVKQTADKIDWIVANGTNASNFSLTSRMASLVASEINLTGYVTIDSLKTPGQTIIDGGNITTGTITGRTIQGGTVKAGRYYNTEGDAYLSVSTSTNDQFSFISSTGRNLLEIRDAGVGYARLATNGYLFLEAMGGVTSTLGSWTFNGAVSFGSAYTDRVNVDFSYANVKGLPATTAIWA